MKEAKDTQPVIKEFYNLDQLSEELNISKQTLRKEIADGKLKAAKKCGRLIITRDAIIEWLDN